MITAIVIIIIALVVSTLIVAGHFMAKTVCTPKVYTEEHEKGILSDWGFDYEAFVAELEANGGQESFEYESQYGYKLRGFIVRSKNANAFKDGRPRVAVFCHGYTSNRVTIAPYAKMYYDLGFNLVFYDHRGHGISDSCFCSMSHYEAKDLTGLVHFLQQSFPQDALWGIHGESMGSATLMTAAPDIECLSFCVEDCGFTDMKRELAATMKFKFNLPSFPLLQLGCMAIRLRFGFSVNAVRPIDHIKDIEVPMLFVHGGADRFVPTEMVYELFEQKKDKKELHIFEGCTHAKSMLAKSDEYRQVLTDFLKKYSIID